MKRVLNLLGKKNMKTEKEIRYKLDYKELKEKKLFRVFKPIVEQKKCTLCRRCVVFCPHSAISIIDKRVRFDYSLCDGCLICLRECEPGAIKEERE